MNTGTSGARVFRWSPCGTFISSTMIVMMIARTPSLNASSLFLPTFGPVSPKASPAHTAAGGTAKRTPAPRARGGHGKKRPQYQQLLGDRVADFGHPNPHVHASNRQPQSQRS